MNLPATLPVVLVAEELAPAALAVQVHAVDNEHTAGGVNTAATLSDHRIVLVHILHHPSLIAR